MILSKYNEVFNNEKKRYVYNMASKALIEVDEKIGKLLDGENVELDDHTSKLLYENGIITESSEFETGRLINNMNNVRFDLSKMAIFLSLTPDCNLNCSYCYQDARKELNKCDQYLTSENWEKIKVYLENTIEEKNISTLTIFLFGGEPMYKSDQLIQYIKELKELKTRVILVLITNGTLFNKDNVEFYCKNIDSVQITMDGNKEIHDRMKPYKSGKGTFDDILNNLKMLIKNNVQELTLRVNLNKETIPEAYRFVDFLCEEKINESIAAVKFAAIFSTQNEVIDNEESNENMTEELGDLYLYAARKGLKTYKDFDGGMCVGKIQNGMTIDEKLNVYSCPGVVYQEPTAILQNNKISIKSAKWYNFLQDDPECIKSCKYAAICYGGCKWSRECNKKIFEIIFKKVMQAYVISYYSD